MKMMKMILMLMLTLMSATAAADTAYVVHASEGVVLSEFTRQRDACDAATREELARLLSNRPIVTVREDAMLFTTMRVDSEAKTFRLGVDAVGTWVFGTKVLTVSLHHFRMGSATVLDVELTRSLGGRPCRELWSGVVSPVRTRETLRGR